MAWGHTKVAQRAKTIFRKLHTHELQAPGKESRDPLARWLWGVRKMRWGHLWPHFWGVYFGKVITALKANVIWSIHWRSLSNTKETEVTPFGPRCCFLAILSIRVRAGRVPGTPEHWSVPSPAWAPALIPGQTLVSVFSGKCAFLSSWTGCKRLFRTQAQSPWRGQDHNGFEGPLSYKPTFLILQKHSPRLKSIELSLCS